MPPIPQNVLTVLHRHPMRLPASGLHHGGQINIQRQRVLRCSHPNGVPADLNNVPVLEKLKITAIECHQFTASGHGVIGHTQQRALARRPQPFARLVDEFPDLGPSHSLRLTLRDGDFIGQPLQREADRFFHTRIGKLRDPVRQRNGGQIPPYRRRLL
jgi:hypothetical protein